jgi:hypothetical protein
MSAFAPLMGVERTYPFTVESDAIGPEADILGLFFQRPLVTHNVLNGVC